MEEGDSWRSGLDRADWAAQVKDYAIIRLDRDGLVLSWNAGAKRVNGHPRGAILGRSFELFYTAEDREAGLPRQLLAIARRDGSVEHQGWRLRRDGTRFWADVNITAIRDDAGQLLGYVKVTRDLTEQHRLEQARELFLAGVSHDFRSPLTSIEGYAAMLAAELTDPSLGDFATRIRSNAVRLMKLVDLMVEHARLRAGGTLVALEPVRLGAVLQGVVDDLSSTVEEHEVVVEPTDAVMIADPTALARVFTNILSNAAKYSPAGSRIDVHVNKTTDGRVEVVVADRGRGIDDADVAAIFNEFERGRRAENDGGFGLGLAVVRHLVEMHSGVVEIGSGRYGGTDVTVRLPLGPVEDGPAIPGQFGTAVRA